MFDNYYGLTGRPFQLTPDPAFFFESQTHRKALSYLGYGLAQGEGFVVITGEVGAGKSTLVAHLMATIDPARLTAAQVVTSRLDGEEIVHVVAQAFGLLIDGHDKASALGAIENFLHEEARAGRRCLLIVDEAQNLSVDALEELRMLSNFQLGAHPLLQTLLLGQPEFRETLSNHPALEQLRQRVIASHHLGAMEMPEVQQYIEHRLKCVGWDGNPSFDQRVFAEIHEATGGIPRRVNQVVSRLLMLGSVEERSHFDGPMVRTVIEELDGDASTGLPQPAAESVEAVDAPVVEPEPVAPVAEEPAPLAETDADAREAESFAVQAPAIDELPVSELILDTEFLESDDEPDLAEPEVVSAPDAPTEFAPFAAPQDEEVDVDAPTEAEASPAAEDCVDDTDEAGEEDVAEIAPSEPQDSELAGIAMAHVEALLAERDAQIVELQQAVIELADAGEENEAQDRSAGDQIEALIERVTSLEARAIEQDRTIRHTLTMLIEWIETGEGSRDAA